MLKSQGGTTYLLSLGPFWMRNAFTIPNRVGILRWELKHNGSIVGSRRTLPFITSNGMTKLSSPLAKKGQCSTTTPDNLRHAALNSRLAHVPYDDYHSPAACPTAMHDSTNTQWVSCGFSALTPSLMESDCRTPPNGQSVAPRSRRIRRRQ